MYANVPAPASPVSAPVYQEINPLPPAVPPPRPQWSATPVSPSGSGAGDVDAATNTPKSSSQICRTGAEFSKLALAHLTAAGVDDPEFDLVRLYRRHVRGTTPFDEQVRSAAERYQEDSRVEAYLIAAFDLAKRDRALFDQLRSLGGSEEERLAIGGRTYVHYCARTKLFNGPNAALYLRSFENQPIAIHERVLADAMALARSHTGDKRPGVPFESRV